MTQKPKSDRPDESAAPSTMTNTPHGQVILEDFSLDHMMSSFDDDHEEAPTAGPDRK